MTIPNVTILLSRRWLDCLKRYAAKDSVEGICLCRAQDISDIWKGTPLKYSVTCTKEEIEAILDLSLQHCPAAAPEIKDAIDRFPKGYD